MPERVDLDDLADRMATYPSIPKPNRGPHPAIDAMIDQLEAAPAGTGVRWAEHEWPKKPNGTTRTWSGLAVTLRKAARARGLEIAVLYSTPRDVIEIWRKADHAAAKNLARTNATTSKDNQS